MSWRRREHDDWRAASPEPRPAVRVLRDQEELAAAAERAAEGQRRLEARLAARARHEAALEGDGKGSRGVIPWPGALRGHSSDLPPPRRPAA